jgi:NAD(P)-dependent dehydrogenase (short-subunit alcohol dehydrogenase family)
VRGKTVVVTGANSGIGYQTAKRLAEMGAHVVMACRSMPKADRAREHLRSQIPDARLEPAQLDLSDPGSIQRFAYTMRDRRPALDVLVNNAGVWNRQRQATAEGFEQTFAVNHLGTFRLTHALMPLLRAAPAARVVTVASAMHHFARFDWQDLQMTRRYDGTKQYANTKLWNIWFAKELATRLAGTNVVSNALHPGTGGTGLTRDLPRAVHWAARVFTKRPSVLAHTQVRLASDPELDGVTGGYFHAKRRAHQSRTARDARAAERMWDVTEELA